MQYRRGGAVIGVVVLALSKGRVRAARLGEDAKWDRGSTRGSGSWDCLIVSGSRWEVLEDGGVDEDEDEEAVQTPVRSVR